MSYNAYKARVANCRVALQAELSQANDLRQASNLPLRDVQTELDQQCPLLDQEAWTAQQQERRASARFKRGALAGMVMPSSPPGADWQEQRALVLRRAFLEHQIRQTWLSQPHARIL